MVLLNGDAMFVPLTVKVTEIEPTAALGVTSTEELVDEVGVPPVIDHAYVGDVMFVVTALSVVLAGLTLRLKLLFMVKQERLPSLQIILG